ncbi:MAG: 2,3,4,5-tetrahydropyridine-2,6-dicarboxylate N-acetyltransferase [Clostridiales bacterium]|nr:2,3,4,5-tetrahydropyridine-2,6-dicarboxylate N-acetyltransferase [Clostridiales bacterium]
MDAKYIIQHIKNSIKKTPVKVYIKGELENIDWSKWDVKNFTTNETGVIIGDWNVVIKFLNKHSEFLDDFEVENDRRNSALPMLDIKNINARIEPGAIIREKVEIGDNAVIMMGAVINIGAVIGEGTMIDMNVVIGGRAIIGKNCHIGAGAVIAGVIEPPSAMPAVVEDGVVIGANAVILEGVRVKEGAVIAAGAVVTEDVPANVVVAGTPAKKIKNIDGKTKSKTKIVKDLRVL